MGKMLCHYRGQGTQGSYILYVLVEKVDLWQCRRETSSAAAKQIWRCFQGQQFILDLSFEVDADEKSSESVSKSVVNLENEQTQSAGVDRVTWWKAVR